MYNTNKSSDLPQIKFHFSDDNPEPVLIDQTVSSPATRSDSGFLASDLTLLFKAQSSSVADAIARRLVEFRSNGSIPADMPASKAVMLVQPAFLRDSTEYLHICELAARKEAAYYQSMQDKSFFEAASKKVDNVNVAPSVDPNKK